MNLTASIIQLVLFSISLPARMKGMKFETGSAIGPSYDFLFVQMKNIMLKSNATIGKDAWVQTIGEGSIVIGEHSTIGRRCTISSNKKILIGNHCVISYDVSILDHDHHTQSKKIKPTDNLLTKGQEIVIEDECFIGAKSTILKGVHLGKHCVVGANSVVTKSFPAFSVLAGNPAQLIRTIRS